MRKTYILDTNIVLDYPDAVYGFEDNIVELTAGTIEELDRIGHERSDRAFKARTFFRSVLKPLRDEAVSTGTSLSEGIPINEGTGLFCISTHSGDLSEQTSEFSLPTEWNEKYNDNALLLYAKQSGGILVTDDGMLLAKAAALGVQAQEYRNAQVIDDNYTGMGEMIAPKETIDTLMQSGMASFQDKTCIITGAAKDNKIPTNNEYFVIKDADNPKHTVLARYCNGYLYKLKTLDKRECKVVPKNAKQQFAIDALMNPDIPFVILEGPAGTAKTFLSVTCGMQQLGDNGFEQIIATRNNVEFDRSIGALPGDELEKVSPLVRGVIDNLRAYLKIQGTAASDISMTIDDYLDTGVISIESMGFMRGRSIPNTFLILEECQNATAEQVKSIVTRAAENCKIVLTGDSSQIDNSSLTPKTCGIAVARYVMRDSPLCAQLKFSEEECVRSPLAKEAAVRFGNI